MRWPWQARKETIAERKEAEARADNVHETVSLSLRRMREENHLTPALISDIRKRLQEGGN